MTQLAKVRSEFSNLDIKNSYAHGSIFYAE